MCFVGCLYLYRFVLSALSSRSNQGMHACAGHITYRCDVVCTVHYNSSEFSVRRHIYSSLVSLFDPFYRLVVCIEILSARKNVEETPLTDCLPKSFFTVHRSAIEQNYQHRTHPIHRLFRSRCCNFPYSGFYLLLEC